MDFIRTNILRDHTSATEKLELDLPTNPISHLIFSLSGFNMTDEATLAEILAFLNTLEVLDNGSTVISLQSEDLYGINTYLYGNTPILTNMIATDNLPRTLSLIIPFGRFPFNPNECYPARKKGELTLIADMTALGTSIDNGIVNIEAVQLPGATPQKFLKSRLMVLAAPGATGDNTKELPTGNEIVALQFRVTTWQAAAAHTTGIENVKILVDEIEKGYSSACFECLTGDKIFIHGGCSTNQAANGYLAPVNMFWIDYDPVRNSEFLLDVKQASSAKAILNMGVNEAAYMTVLELCDVVNQ